MLPNLRLYHIIYMHLFVAVIIGKNNTPSAYCDNSNVVFFVVFLIPTKQCPHTGMFQLGNGQFLPRHFRLPVTNHATFRRPVALETNSALSPGTIVLYSWQL